MYFIGEMLGIIKLCKCNFLQGGRIEYAHDLRVNVVQARYQEREDFRVSYLRYQPA